MAVFSILLILMIYSVSFSKSAVATNANPPVIKVVCCSIVTAGAPSNFSLILLNPISNAYAVTYFVINVPSGWTAISCTTNNLPGVACSHSTSAIGYNLSATLAPGASESLGFSAVAPPVFFPYYATLTTSVKDASSVVAYAGYSIAVKIIAPLPTQVGFATCFVRPTNATWYCPASDTPAAYAAGGTVVYLDFFLESSSGARTTNPCGCATPVQLSVTGGALSATTTSIPANQSDTYGGSGSVAWMMPSAAGTIVSLTAAAQGNGVPPFSITGAKVLTAVSTFPTISTSFPTPVNGTIFSRLSPIAFRGYANVSVGYPLSTTISSVNYRVNASQWLGTTFAPGNKILWHTSIGFPRGLSAVQFEASDSRNNTFATTPIQVLVDDLPPAARFGVLNGSSISPSTPLSASLVDAEGDLDFGSIVVRLNGTVNTEVSVTVAGSNNLGQNSTYQVSLSNIPAGKWQVELDVADLSGNSVSAEANVQVATPNTSNTIILIAELLIGSAAGAGILVASLAVLNNLPKPIKEPDIPQDVEVTLKVETEEEVKRTS